MSRQGSIWLNLISTSWLLGGAALLLLAAGVLLAGGWSIVERGMLGATGVTSIVLGLCIMVRFAWVRLGASVAHLFLAVALLIVLWFDYPYDNFVSVLPGFFTEETWSNGLAFVLFLMLVGSLGAAYYLELPTTWDLFSQNAAPRLKNTCPACGIKRKRSEPCDYCDSLEKLTIFLQPALPDTSRILFQFEPGNETLDIGRAVDLRAGYIDAGENRLFATVARHHASLTYDFDDERLRLSRGATSAPLRLNNVEIFQTVNVKVGDIIQMGEVLFVVGDRNYQPEIAYWSLQNDPDSKQLLVFQAQRKPRLTVGRSRANDVVIPFNDVSGKHATIVYIARTNQFVIKNESQGGEMRVDSFDVPAGKSRDLNRHELTIVELTQHNYLFTPIPYNPPASEVPYA